MPAVFVAPMRLVSESEVGDNPAPATLTIQNTGRRTLAWTAKPVSWIRVLPPSGTIAPRSKTGVTVQVLTTKFAEARRYYGWVDIIADVTLRVVVNLTLTEPVPVADPLPPKSVEMHHHGRR